MGSIIYECMYHRDYLSGYGVGCIVCVYVLVVCMICTIRSNMYNTYICSGVGFTRVDCPYLMMDGTSQSFEDTVSPPFAGLTVELDWVDKGCGKGV